MAQFLVYATQHWMDKELHELYRKKYAGMNQTAFGWMLENYEKEIKIVSANCAEWNLYSEHWKDINDYSRILHIKGRLRMY